MISASAPPNSAGPAIALSGIVGDKGEKLALDEVIVAQAQQADAVQKDMPFREAFRVYWRGILWSMLLSVALIMEGK